VFLELEGGPILDGVLLDGSAPPVSTNAQPNTDLTVSVVITYVAVKSTTFSCPVYFQSSQLGACACHAAATAAVIR